MIRIVAVLVGICLSASASMAKAPAEITLPGDRLHPESVSIAPDGHAYVGGMQGGVLRVTLASGTVEPFVKPGDFGTGSTFGVFADTVNNILWACSNPGTAMSAKVAGVDPQSTLKGFDLRTGKGRFSIPLAGKGAMCNDMAVAKDGTLYVTDTTSSHILRLRRGATALEDWHHDAAYAGTGSGLDGIALGGDGNLYVNNWQANLMARVEVKPDGTAGKTTVLQPSQPLGMPDGLRAIGGMRFVQAESSTGKVTIVTVSGDTAQVEVIKDGLSSPTGADLHDGTIWYVQAEFGYFFDARKKDAARPPFKLSPVVVPAGHAHH